MGGGLIQLVAYGAQDVYLTGNPQITFFKVVYRRHTNFARENIEQVFDGNAAVGSSVVCTLSRSGDLVNNIYLTTLLTHTQVGNTTDLPHNLGHMLIKTCEVEIGGQKIDKHYSQWLQIWAELHGLYDRKAGDDDNDATGHQTSIKYLNAGYNSLVCGIGEENAAATVTKRLYVPLRFWFCNNPGLALPLIALQYHEVKIKMTFETSANLTNNHATTDMTTAISDSKLLVDYIYLDTDERRRFAQVSHEYLIEQLQHEGSVSATDAGSSANITVNYNHPVKYIAWAVEDGNRTKTNTVNTCPLTFLPISAIHTDTSNGEGSCKLMLNGNDRFEEREMSYFTRVQTHQNFGVVPADNRIGVYSFANNPKDHQPSGTCNFSRIDSAIFQMKYGDNIVSNSDGDKLFMFAVNYNVLRVMSGMGGLAYSN
jgi:hypothetical protein